MSEYKHIMTIRECMEAEEEPPTSELPVDNVVSVEKIEIEFNQNKLKLLSEKQRNDLITTAFLECTALLKTGLVDIDIDDPKKIVIQKR